MVRGGVGDLRHGGRRGTKHLGGRCLAAHHVLGYTRPQRFSYTDAVSFAVMRSRAVTDAFAFDQHFSTAGFVRVPAV